MKNVLPVSDIMRWIVTMMLMIDSATSSGQSYKLYSSDSDLSSSLITRLYQDRHNIIWIATENGLNRFDGSKVTQYYHNPADSTSLCNDYVYAICEDKDGNLIIGTHKGVQVYDYASDSFGKVSVYDDGTPFETNIRGLLPLDNGEILVSGDYLCSLRIENGRPIARRLNFISGVATDKLLLDTRDNIWISSERNGLYRKSSDGRIARYFDDDASTLIDMILDLDGNLYAAVIDKGMFRYDSANDVFVKVLDDPRLPINNLKAVGKNEIYIATDGKGLKSFNCVTRKTEDILYNMQSFDFSTAKIHSILQDNAWNIWLAIYQRGIVMIPKETGPFRYIGSKSIEKDIIGHNCITSFSRIPSGDMLIGTDNDGLYSITDDGRKGVHFKPSGMKNSVPAIVLKIYVDSRSKIWIGSFIDGLCVFDYNTGYCNYMEGLVDDNGNTVIGVSDIVEDGYGRLWIATIGGGIYYYDLNTSILHKYQTEVGPAINSWTNALALDNDGNLYIGTYNGIYSINTTDQSLTQGKYLPKYLVYDIMSDDGGLLWIGTSEGLLCWDITEDTVVKYTTADRLPSNTIYAIKRDENGNIWIGTNNGLSRFNPRVGSFANYSVDDGLQGREFSKKASYKDSNGMLWFGGINGITYFNPQIIKDISYNWKIRLTGFYIQGDRPVNTKTMSGGDRIVYSPIFDATDFYLSHDDNSFSLEMAPVEYNAPNQLAFQYSVNDGEWTMVSRGINRIYFNNLSPGNYRIRVRAVDGDRASDDNIYNVHIASPWWRSKSAYLAYFIMILVIAFVILWQRNIIINKRKEIREREIHEEINDAKLTFMTNIMHEIRTPMTLIAGPLGTIMTDDKDPGRQRMYHTMHRNIERILSLVNQLIDLRRLDKCKLSLKFAQIDIVAFINNIIQLYEYQNLNRNISLEFDHESSDRLDVWISPMYFDKIIGNLLSNAFKYTPTGGNISIRLKVHYNSNLDEPLNNHVEIVVDDNGIGIDPADLENIFNRFYQGKNSYNISKPGTGIGLDLARSLVKLHFGTIHAENNQYGGARFVVRLPLGNSHLSKEDLCEDEVALNSGISKSVESVESLSLDETKQRSSSKNKVLVVEDDDEIRQYIINALSPYYHMLEADNGKEGISIAFKHKPNLIISDIMMPEMDGMSMCQSIKRNINLNHIPVILLTAKVEESDNMKGLEAGADAYITKPFTVKFLKRNVDSLLAKYEQLRNTFGDRQIQDGKLDEISVKSHDEKLMDRIMSVINSNLDNQNLTADFIADKVGLSRTHLYRKLKELTNQSTRDFIRNVRLRQAANLMSQKHYTVNEVARLTGFSDANNFSTAFKKLYGVSPTEYMTENSSVK